MSLIISIRYCNIHIMCNVNILAYKCDEVNWSLLTFKTIVPTRIDSFCTKLAVTRYFMNEPCCLNSTLYLMIMTIMRSMCNLYINSKRMQSCFAFMYISYSMM